MTSSSCIYRERPLQDLWHETHPGKPIPTELDQYANWHCIIESQVVGHCTGNSATGEIVGLAVLAAHQGHGIGRKLLSLVVEKIQAAHTKRIWLAAPSDPTLRAYGFYRAVGWTPTGQRTADGSDILELPSS
jgi:ribosomal protein S18 acetylase RimI-like enzyme